MENVGPSMRLKLKKGTFFMPEPNGSVYFRNNSGSFRMEGSTIKQWVEKLIPMLNGEYTMANLTDGLQPLYRDRVYEITDVLYQNGFLQDVSKDRPHNLSEHVKQKFASQIAYLESFGDSAAFRFQQYRQQRILAIGEGTMVIGLTSALLQSGLAHFHTVITNLEETNHQRLLELEAEAKKTDPEVSMEVLLQSNNEPILWEGLVEGFDVILYATDESKIEELQKVFKACQEKGKLFIPAIRCINVGIAGPLISSDSSSCFESALRSLPENIQEKNHQVNSYTPAEFMLTNVLVFECFKRITGVKEAHHTNHVYLLNMETLEGRWHPFKPHPLVTGKISAEREEIELNKISNMEDNRNRNELLYYFHELSASPLGIFYRWEEDTLKQLPLSQCMIQVADVTSEGPSTLHPSIVKAAMTHEEARIEAGLSGIEQYAKPLTNEILASFDFPTDRDQDLPAYLHLGAGGTTLEAVSRALAKCIEYEWKKYAGNETENVAKIVLNSIDDKRCHYYWQALQGMNKTPELGLGKDAFGFPVVWVKSDGTQWRGCVGFNQTLALREALLLTLIEAQNNTIISHPFPSLTTLSFEEKAAEVIDVPAYETGDLPKVLSSVMERLSQYNKKPSLVKVLLDPFLSDGAIDIYGVWLDEEEEEEEEKK